MFSQNQCFWNRRSTKVYGKALFDCLCFGIVRITKKREKRKRENLCETAPKGHWAPNIRNVKKRKERKREREGGK